MVAVTYLVLSPTIRPYVPSKHDPTRSKGGMTQSSTVSSSNAAVYWVRAGSTISVAAPCACDVAEDQTLTISDDENEEQEVDQLAGRKPPAGGGGRGGSEGGLAHGRALAPSSSDIFNRSRWRVRAPVSQPFILIET